MRSHLIKIVRKFNAIQIKSINIETPINTHDALIAVDSNVEKFFHVPKQ
jgi:hypothetical protein